jgi:cytochrome c1
VANLEAWITHAQSLKPGVLMPDLPQYSGRELRALTTYVGSLR